VSNNMLALFLLIITQIFNLNLAVHQPNKLFKSSEKRADSYLGRNFDPSYSWGNAGAGGGAQPRFKNRRKYFRGRPEVRQLSPTPDPRPLQSTPQQNTSVTPTPQPGMYGTYIVTRSSWVCQEITTRILIVTMIPTCIISLDITTPKFNRTMCSWMWVSIIGITPIPVMTCVPLTTCILLDHVNSTDILTPSAETECINITSMVTRIATFENNRTKVVTVTTCIYLEPNITCYPTTCIPVNNKTISPTGRNPPPRTFSTEWTTHPTETPPLIPPLPVTEELSNGLERDAARDNTPSNNGKRGKQKISGKTGKRGKRGKRIKRIPMY